MAGFNYIPVLSREDSPGWKGEKGYVHEVYKRLFADKKELQFYICGWKVMILEAVENLKQMGFEKADIRFELYD
jgi:NAD(P)H-flavin reductase